MRLATLVVVCFIKPKVKGEEAVVYSYESVYELNIKAKNWYDLTTGLKFSKKDIVIIQDPSDPEVCAKRDISKFKFLKDGKEGKKKVRTAIITVVIRLPLRRYSLNASLSSLLVSNTAETSLARSSQDDVVMSQSMKRIMEEVKGKEITAMPKFEKKDDKGEVTSLRDDFINDD